MKEITIWNTSIEFQFNEPLEETWFISETFDIRQKPAYGTNWITDIIKGKSEIHTQLIIGQIFQEFYQTAKIQKLDYLQKLSINEIEVWCIDNGSTICLLTKEEY